MAKQSGLINKDYDSSFLNKFTYAVENFAKLVAQHEREACAKLCAEFGIQGWDCEEAIRARGQA
jgi:hypothetical protein